MAAKRFRPEIIPLDGNGDEAQQDQEDETSHKPENQALHAIAVLNFDHDEPVLLHASMMKHSINLKISTADSEVIQT